MGVGGWVWVGVWVGVGGWVWVGGWVGVGGWVWCESYVILLGTAILLLRASES